VGALSNGQLIEAQLQSLPVVPLIQAEDVAVAVATARALVAGGLPVIEVVMRTDAALSCISAIANEVQGAMVGAGTVLSAAHASAAADAGAQFIVSPGLSEQVVATALSLKLPVYPGISTASEAQSAWNMGLRTVKFFPASLAGGVPMLKALASVFRDLRFMPTGGISAANLAEYLAVPAVIACGGSWLTPAAAIKAGDYAAVTQLAVQAAVIAAAARS
jgi:2-dehydro-3-deoxyphosphogluconate aldolase/(4S)-4-hydroxy-2-oxoglutarate aldolase